MMLSFSKERRVLKTLLDKEQSFLALDLEMTGLNPKKDRIVQLGMIPFDHGEIRIKNAVSAFVQHDFVGKGLAIHEITPEQTIHGWSEEDLLNEFMHYSMDRVLVGHYLELDIAFLKSLYRRYDKKWKSPQLIDTLLLSLYIDRHKRQEEKSDLSYSLSDLCQRFNIPSGLAHSAIDDALSSALLSQALLFSSPLK
jgi:DNA polymerase-3 subunit epsilon